MKGKMILPTRVRNKFQQRADEHLNHFQNNFNCSILSLFSGADTRYETTCSVNCISSETTADYFGTRVERIDEMQFLHFK